MLDLKRIIADEMTEGENLGYKHLMTTATCDQQLVPKKLFFQDGWTSHILSFSIFLFKNFFFFFAFCFETPQTSVSDF